MRVHEKLGAMTKLITSSVIEVMPFLLIYIVYVMFFAMLYYILGMYPDQFDSSVDNFEGDFAYIRPVFGYFFISYGNGVGDFRPPTFDVGNGEGTSTMVKVLMYIVWFT